MRISEVLHRKGTQVVTIRPDATVDDLLHLLAGHGIGAVVVTDEVGAPIGIVSERDIVRHLHEVGSDYAGSTVRSIMTADIYTCAPDDNLEAVARDLTEHRVRHIPVLVDGRLEGIVSIGDIVKQRIEELQAERDHLESYLQG